MAFGTPVAAAAAYSANNGTSVSPAYPAGILATDEVLLFVGQKPNAANGGTVTTPAGWTLRESLTAAGGYGATLGIDTGNTNLFVYSWDTPVAGQTGNLAVTVGTNGICWAFIVRIPTGDGAVSFGSADGSRTTAPTLNVSFSVALTNGATATNFQAGDLAIWAMCTPTDNPTYSAQSITATGATFGTATELNEPASATGQDVGGYSAWANVTSGSSTAAPSVSVTPSGANQGVVDNVRGPIVLLRIRETTQTLTQGTRFTNTPAFFGPTAQATNSVTPALFTNSPQFYSPTVSLAFDQTLTQNTSFTNTPQFFAATSASPVTLSQIAFGPSNSFKYSEQLNVTASGWSIGGGVTVTADTTTAPDGTTTADSINYVTSSTDFRFVRVLYSIRPGQYYTVSIYVKKNNYRYFGVRPMTLGPGFGTAQEECVFDFDTESFVYTPPTSGVVSTGFVNVGNGWYRIFATAQVAFDRGGARAVGFALTDASGFEQGNTLPAGASVYAWGAQLELSTAPSTYVQTVATAPVQQQVPNVFFAPTVTQTGATQNLTPALYTNTPQFFTATATATNALTPALYTNTPQFFAVTAAASNTLTPALYTNTPAFFAATIAQTNNVLVYWLELEQAASQNLSPALYTNTPQFFAATVTAGAVNLSPALYTNTPQFFGPTVTAGAVNLSPSLYTNTPQFFGAAITQDGSLAQITRFTNTPQFFTATLTAGPVTLTQNTTFTNTPQFFATTATATNALTPALYTNTPQFFTATLTATRNLTPALYTNTPQFFGPTVTAGAVNLSPALYTNTPQFFAPTVTPGAVALTQNTRFTNTPQFFGGSVSVGQSLNPALYTNTPQFFTANLTKTNTLTPALYTNTPAFFATTVTATRALTQATRFTNTPQFFGGTVQQGQFLTFEDYVVAGYVDPPGYVEYIAYFNNVFFTGNLELQISVSGVSATGEVGDAQFLLESIISPTGVQAVGGVGYVNIWGLVDDAQSPGWQSIDDAQNVTWTAVIDSQSAGWQNIDVAQDPDWVDEGACTC